MKSSTIYSDKDGVLRVLTVDVPKKPEDWVDDDGYLASLSSPLYATKMGEYRKAIQHCKDTSVPFGDQKAARKRIENVIVMANTFYTVPEFDCDIESICHKGSCAHSGSCYAEGLSFERCAAKKVARLVSPQQEPEEQDLRQENQRLREALEKIRDFNEDSEYDDPGEIAVEALQNTKEKSKQV